MQNETRLWSRVDKSTTECWLWTGAKDSFGCGRITVNGKNAHVPRVVWTLINGPIPPGLGYHGTVVRHKCDNPLCCKPDHLLLGTHADNMADMRLRGGRKGAAAGEKNGRAKLTLEQVAAIRADTRGPADIARDYGISGTHVQRIKSCESWGQL